MLERLEKREEDGVEALLSTCPPFRSEYEIAAENTGKARPLEPRWRRNARMRWRVPVLALLCVAAVGALSLIVGGAVWGTAQMVAADWMMRRRITVKPGGGYGAGGRAGGWTDGDRRSIARHGRELYEEDQPCLELDHDGGGGQEGRQETPSKPQCYSTPAADPSIGAWIKCDGGIDGCSPLDLDYLGSPWMNLMEQRCRDRWHAQHREGPMPYWKWEPSNCALEGVNPENFCRVMDGRKGILFVGDSLTGQTVDTLAAILDAESIAFKRNAFSKLTACGGALKFSWYRNDYLDTRTTASGGFKNIYCADSAFGSSRCVVFADDAILEEYDTLLVNSGAHQVKGDLEGYKQLMKAASENLTASMERLHGDNAILIVRNTSPGHWDNLGRTFDGPVDIDEANRHVAAGPPSYGWTKFTEKNEIIEEAFLQVAGGNWTLMDVYTPTVLRVDMHGSSRDGLHYCVPGPLDHWITLLYNILSEKTKKATAKV